MKYTSNIYKTYVSLEMERQDFWQDFITVFRQQKIKPRDRDTLTKLYKFQKDIEVHTGTRLTVHKLDHLIEILFRDQHCSWKGYIEKEEKKIKEKEEKIKMKMRDEQTKRIREKDENGTYKNGLRERTFSERKLN